MQQIGVSHDLSITGFDIRVQRMQCFGFIFCPVVPKERESEEVIGGYNGQELNHGWLGPALYGLSATILGSIFSSSDLKTGHSYTQASLSSFWLAVLALICYLVFSFIHMIRYNAPHYRARTARCVLFLTCLSCLFICLGILEQAAFGTTYTTSSIHAVGEFVSNLLSTIMNAVTILVTTIVRLTFGLKIEYL